MDKESRDNTKKKFSLDDAAQRKIDAEFSEPQYSSYGNRRSNREYTHPERRNVQREENPVKPKKKTQSEKQKQNAKAMKKGRAEGKKIRRKQEQSFMQTDEFSEEAVPKKRHLRAKIIGGVIIICTLVILVNVGIWLYTGKIWFNEPKKRDYPVRGPVITEDMGEIRWNKFPKQNIQLAFIRATKSTTYVDKCFDFNWKQSESTSLPVGAMHIFDPSTDGKKQAEHFAETVGKINGRIVPAVDIKLTGVNKVIHSGYDTITERLVNFVEQIEKEYGVYPIISCDEKTYKKIICNETNFSRIHKSNFEGCPIWYQSLTKKPDDDVNWTFWCYTDRARYSYYDSKCYVDVVLYRGSEDQFKKYIIGENNE